MKIWYDISGLYNWQGNFTGIQRIVYSLGKHMSEDENHDSGFFIFQNGSFVEVSWSDLELRREQLSLNRPVHAGSYKVKRTNLQRQGILFAKKVAGNSAFEKPLRSFYNNLRNIYASTTRKKATILTVTHPFKKGDVVIVVDGNWQFPGFAEAIKSTKRQTGYRFMHFVNDVVAIKNPALATEGADRIIGDYFRKVLPVSDDIICISESTKNDVIELLPGFVKQANLYVIKLGSDMLGASSTKKPSINLPKEFILAVSTVEIRKNYLLMYYVYKQAISDGIELPNLVIVGKRGWMVEDTYNLLTKDPEVSQRISILSGVSDEELEWLYENCKFTVFPSFYEGLGLTVAESLARGKACISSNTSSLPEIGGGLVKFISPYATERWVREISSLNNEKLKSLELRIRQNFTAVSWQDSYNELIECVVKR